MKASFRLVGASALALTLALCGCGDKKSTFAPRVGTGVQFAMGVNLDKEQAFRIMDAYTELAFGVPGLVDNEVAALFRGKLAAYKKDLFTDASPSERAFIEKSGIRDAELRWVVVAMQELKIADGTLELDGLSVAIGGKADLRKFFAAVQETPDTNLSFEETNVDGETAWRIVPQDDDASKDFKQVRIDPYVTSLDGRLVLAAMSRDALAKQIRLYRTGSEKGDALGGFTASKGEFMRVHLSGIGDLLRKNMPRGSLKGINRILPDGEELVYGLRSLNVDSKVVPDGLLSDTIRLETASEPDADKIRTLAKTGLMAAVAQMSKEPNVPAKKLVEGVKVGGTDGVVEFDCGGFGVGVMAGTLFPAVSTAMLSANASVLAVNGRRLLVGMTQANIVRGTAGRGPVWPRTAGADGSDKQDVSGRVYASATDYFKALFDMDRKDTSEWNPCLEGGALAALGKTAVAGKTVTAAGLDWCIAANVTDEMPDDTIVLVSANFNPALLLRKWDGKTDGKKPLPIGPKSGALKSMLGNRAVVIVRKGGSAETIKKKYLTYDVLYRRRAFDLTNVNPPLLYLTPTGIAEPVGHE